MHGNPETLKRNPESRHISRIQNKTSHISQNMSISMTKGAIPTISIPLDFIINPKHIRNHSQNIQHIKRKLILCSIGSQSLVYHRKMCIKHINIPSPRIIRFSPIVNRKHPHTQWKHHVIIMTHPITINRRCQEQPRSFIQMHMLMIRQDKTTVKPIGIWFFFVPLQETHPIGYGFGFMNGRHFFSQRFDFFSRTKKRFHFGFCFCLFRLYS